jgi:phytoene/squalene synthetase
MGRIYFALLEEIEAQRFQVFGERITVPTGRKVSIAFRCWAAARYGAGSSGGRAA